LLHFRKSLREMFMKPGIVTTDGRLS
jgi:hypothetical protein